MKTTISELAILFLIGIAIMCSMFISRDEALVVLVGAAIFSALMYAIIKFLYPDNELDEKINDDL